MDEVDRALGLSRAMVSLEGVSVGDAFGEQWFAPARMRVQMSSGAMIPGSWGYTDDTNMALSIYAVLRQCGEIEQDTLAASFARHFDPRRRYGAAARKLLADIRDGADWRVESATLFGGTGSYGNGAAMRVMPLGAYFADDLSKVVEQARLSAVITHTHAEGIAGAIAAAVATAVAWNLRGQPVPGRAAFIDAVILHVPESEVRQKLVEARDLPVGVTVRDAAIALGNGRQISAQDTLGLCLWAAGEYLDNYEKALGEVVQVGGDIDTNCAIIGGIVAAYTGVEAIPAAWRAACEPLPKWIFEEEL